MIVSVIVVASMLLTTGMAGDTVRTQIYEGVSVDLPKVLRPMSEDLLRSKYLGGRQPLAAYTGPNQQLAFALNVSSTRWQAGDLAVLKDFYRASLLELYDEVDFIKEGVEEINGRSFAVFEFVSVVRPDEDDTSLGGAPKPIRQYTYVQYTVHQNKTWIFNFSVPTQAQAQWQKTAQEMMSSVRMK